jgi:peptidoglycan/LPS O-acetylase OafA/YrhL
VKKMSAEVNTVRSFFTKLNLAALALSIVILVLSVTASSKSQAYFSIYAIILIVFILLGQFRVNRARDLKQIGERAVQTIWLWCSLGLVALVMPPAPYFELSMPVIVAMVVIGVILVVMGAYGLLRVRKLTGVYLSI